MPGPWPETSTPQNWVVEHDRLSAADRRGVLPPEDLERLAVAAHMVGRDDQMIGVRERAYEGFVAQGRSIEAARCAFWLGFHLINRGDMARAAGLRARVFGALGAEIDADSGLSALFLQAEAAQLMFAGDAAGGRELFARASQRARSAGDIDAYVLARLGYGRCVAMFGDPMGAIAVLDEVMAHVIAGACAPQITGLAYCSMIELCIRRFDWDRVRQWTEALGSWCDEQAGMVPFQGQCQVHRADLLQLRGAWSEAVAEARMVADHAVDPPWTAGSACYRMAEIARLQGHLDAAEEAYERAGAYGVEVQPGLALLRAAQGDPTAALVGLDRAIAEDAESTLRPALQAARVEIALSVEDVAAARDAADDLWRLAEDADVPYLYALAEHARGALALAEGEPKRAILALRRAWTLWRQIDAPYEGARTRLLLGSACGQLGDRDGARMETDAGRAVLERLGASAAAMGPRSVDGNGAHVSAAPHDGPGGHPLSTRELEVLRLIATGATNRQIADALVLSEKTVARHVANIFGKLAVSSRSAATAFAYQHRLV